MEIISIKPLSVNDAYVGKRFKSSLYKSFETQFMDSLPYMVDLYPKMRISFGFGFASSRSDVDNPVKTTMDCLQKKYGFNDSHVYKVEAEKFVVGQGNEFISFFIEEYILEEIGGDY